MSDELINPLPSIIIDPAAGDTERAEDIIEELRQVMRKHNCVLMMADGPKGKEMALCKISDPAMMKARAIAGIKDISPMAATWRKISWTPKVGKLR